METRANHGPARPRSLAVAAIGGAVQGALGGALPGLAMAAVAGLVVSPAVAPAIGTAVLFALAGIGAALGAGEGASSVHGATTSAWRLLGGLAAPWATLPAVAIVLATLEHRTLFEWVASTATPDRIAGALLGGVVLGLVAGAVLIRSTRTDSIAGEPDDRLTRVLRIATPLGTVWRLVMAGAIPLLSATLHGHAEALRYGFLFLLLVAPIIFVVLLGYGLSLGARAASAVESWLESGE